MSKLHRLTTALVEDPQRPGQRVALRVDGVDLIERVRAVEMPFADGEGVPALAGNYAWPLLTPALIRLLAGNADGQVESSGTLLNCECGAESCWPFTARIRCFDRIVTWHELRQAKRAKRWHYATLEPLRFERTHYFEEIARLRSWLAESAISEPSRTPAILVERPLAISCAM